MTTNRNPNAPSAGEKTAPPWRRFLSAARTHVERLLHPVRRRVAYAKLRGVRGRNFLFVCEGNIYRSPFAAACFTATLPQPVRMAVRVGSAGFVGPGRNSPPDAVEAAHSFQLDLTPHRSGLLAGSLDNDWDVIVVMDSRQARALRRLGVKRAQVVVLGDLDPLPVHRRAIADPWRQPAIVLQTSYARIDRCVQQMTRILWSENAQLLPATRTGSDDNAVVSS